MPVWGEVCRNTILDLRTWEELEEKLKELQEKVPDERRPEPLPFLYRGQENSCWTITTTLERPLDGRESMPSGDYYLSIYRAKPEIESYTEKSWPVPDPPEVKRLTERVPPFVSFTKERLRSVGSSGELHGVFTASWVSLALPRLDPLAIRRGFLRLPGTYQRREKSIYLRLLRNAKSKRLSQGVEQ